MSFQIRLFKSAFVFLVLSQAIFRLIFFCLPIFLTATSFALWNDLIALKKAKCDIGNLKKL